jgi:hypothetical protein
VPDRGRVDGVRREGAIGPPRPARARAGAERRTASASTAPARQRSRGRRSGECGGRRRTWPQRRSASLSQPAGHGSALALTPGRMHDETPRRSHTSGRSAAAHGCCLIAGAWSSRARARVDGWRLSACRCARQSSRTAIDLLLSSLRPSANTRRSQSDGAAARHKVYGLLALRLAPVSHRPAARAHTAFTVPGTPCRERPLGTPAVHRRRQCSKAPHSTSTLRRADAAASRRLEDRLAAAQAIEGTPHLWALSCAIGSGDAPRSRLWNREPRPSAAMRRERPAFSPSLLGPKDCSVMMVWHCLLPRAPG